MSDYEYNINKQINKKPVKYFGNSHLSTPLPQTDPCCGGVSQDMPTNWLLGISLKPKKERK